MSSVGGRTDRNRTQERFAFQKREGFPDQQSLTHERSASRRADRCDVMHCATTSGIGSKIVLPGREGHVGGTAADNRLFVEAVLFRFRAGIPWRDLPERFGDWKIVYQRFNRSAKSGVFARVFKLLASDHDNEYMMIDATIVRAHQLAPAPKKRRRASHRPIPRRIDHQDSRARRRPRQSRRGDAQRGPGSRSDLRRASDRSRRSRALIADKAFDADAFIDALNALAITPVLYVFRSASPRQ